MHSINLQTWPRRQYFELFSQFDHPHFNMCANVDLTTFLPFVRNGKISFSVALIYVISRASNAIPEFRHRIRSGGVVEHDLVNPSVTILVDDDLFSFCTITYSVDFSEFAAAAARTISHVKDYPTLKNDPDQDDLLYMTAIPWVSFTSFMHPMQLHPADSIPRYAWGKFTEDGKHVKMPLSVQGHHALMDGIHMARFYTRVQDYLDQPEYVLGGP